MIPETESAFYMPGTGHVVDVPHPSFPDRAGLGSVHRTLALQGIGGIGNFPFAGPARFFCVFFSVKLALNNHGKSPLMKKMSPDRAGKSWRDRLTSFVEYMLNAVDSS
jgi:hypothetical protein